MDARYTGENTFLRLWPPGMVTFAFVVLTGAGTRAGFFAGVFTLCALVSARFLPWRFQVFEDGLQLFFPFGRRLFLPKDDTSIAVGIGGAVARRRDANRFGYPLSDGIVEKRRLVLRAVLIEHGYHLTL